MKSQASTLLKMDKRPAEAVSKVVSKIQNRDTEDKQARPIGLEAISQFLGRQQRVVELACDSGKTAIADAR